VQQVTPIDLDHRVEPSRVRLPHTPESGFGQFNHPIIMDEGAPMAPSLVPAPSFIDQSRPGVERFICRP
jgi:hypothetical protein